jgi:hypothetical protein
MKQVIAAVLILIVLTGAIFHPLKMAYTSVKYDDTKKVFLISHRVFQDDFELTLKNNYAYSGNDVFKHQHSAPTQKAINDFFNKNFRILLNGQMPNLAFRKIEQKNDMGIIVWYETGRLDIKKIKTISIFNFIMMESFQEQVNMFHLNIGDTVKRTLKFEGDKTKEEISLKLF